MPRKIPPVVDVLDPELWDGPDRLTADDGRTEYGLMSLGPDCATTDMEDPK